MVDYSNADTLDAPSPISRQRWRELERKLGLTGWEVDSQTGDVGQRNVAHLVDGQGNRLYSGAGGTEAEAFLAAIEAAENDL